MRPTDWSPLGLGADPTPGDPTVVRTGGQKYTNIADAIARAASTLRRLDAGASNADSVKALLESRDDMTNNVAKAEGRYRATGEALTSYATTLDRVQGETLQALTRARTAAADLADANKMAQYYGDQANSASDPTQAADKADYQKKQQQQQDAATTAHTAITTEQGNVQQSIADRDSAAQTAIDKIHNITESDGLNDSWWDDWGAKLTEWIATIAEAISTIAGILALLVCWIPVIGQALAGILLIVAAVAAVVAALANIALAATGKKSWTEAIVSVVCAVLSCVGLGGAGKAGAAMFKAMMKQGAKMAGKEGGSLLGTLGMKTLLRPGAMSRIATGKTFNGIKGALGEEIINVEAFASKNTFKVFDPKTGLSRLAAEPDATLQFFNKLFVGDAKNVASQSLTRQVREYANLAATNGTWFRLFVNEGTKVASTIANYETKIVVNTFENVLGTKLNTYFQLPISFMEGLSIGN